MLSAIALWILMLTAFVAALRLKRRELLRNGCTVPNGKEATVSPLSLALNNLVGIAGGIYLSVVLLLNFLKIPLPQPREIFGCTLDPLAFASLWIAILQPLVLRVYNLLRCRR